MQARKLSLGEAHPSQVVKVEVDVASKCTAILLRNSSCLLFPSFTASSSLPSLIIPSCTDICFLRLRQRSTHLSSSSSSDKSSEPKSGSDPRTLANAKGGPSMHVAERISDALPRVASLNNAAAGSVNEALFFLAIRPAGGGVCTDLLAWRCSGTEFLQNPISLDGSPNGCNGAVVARLEDVSHGISVGIAASVNVVAVHSPAIGKLWIFSAKTSNTKSYGLDLAHSQQDPLRKNPFKNAFEMDRDKLEKECNSCLQLLRCAMLDCNGPVYAMHLSLQHLLLGQLGGIRVWLLRPLIKGSEMARKDLKTAVNHVKCIRLKHERVKTSEDEEFGKKTVEMLRGSNDQHSAPVEGSNDQHSAPVEGSNDQHSALVEGSGSISTYKIVCPVLAAPKNGFYESNVNQCAWNRNTFMNGHSTGRKQGCDIFMCSHHGCIKSITDADMQEEAPSNASKPIQLEAAAMPRYRNGTFMEFDSEELKSQQKLSQFSMFSSSSDSSPQNTRTRSASCHSLTSSVSSVAGAPGPFSAFCKSEFRKGTHAGVFIPLQRRKPAGFAEVEQATSIHGLSEKDFLILDSNGKLHVLTLHYVTRKDETTVHQAPRVSLSASLQHLACGIRIKYLSVFPDLHNSTKNPGYAQRRLWVSDGSHTMYIVTVPPKEPSKEGSGKALATFKNNLTVIATVFLMERAYLLSALCENAVLVLTEGSMLEYSSVGT